MTRHSPSSSETSQKHTRRISRSSRCCLTTSLTGVSCPHLFFTLSIAYTYTEYAPFAAMHKAQPGWRRVIAQAVLWGIPTPAFSTALAFFDGYRSEVVPANLLQAQRDYFGAHTFRVVPGKENAKLKASEDIRTFSDALLLSLISHLR